MVTVNAEGLHCPHSTHSASHSWLLAVADMDTLSLERNPAQAMIQRLNALRRLSGNGIASLERAIREGMQHVGAGEDLIREGDPVDGVRIILSGWLCRYKALEDGRRQIVNFILPGETCDAYAYLLPIVDHSIATLTPVVYAEMKRVQFEAVVARPIGGGGRSGAGRW